MSIRPYDAWALRKLLVGHSLNGELAAVSAPFLSIAGMLAERPDSHEARPRLWDAFLAGCDDRDGIIKALAVSDPDGPPPETASGVGTPPRYKLTCAADVVARPVDWLWRPRVPRGELTLFAGDPKLGKSYVTVAMAAAVSRGAPLPGADPPDAPGSVVMLSAEDSTAHTIVPRLQSAGADRSRIHFLESVYLENRSEAFPSLSADIERIEEAIESLRDCRLVVIDPVSAFLGGTDDHKNSELRGILSPLKALAERTSVAVVLISHLNKSGGSNGKHRVTGSIAYVGACRAGFLFIKDRDDPTGRRVLMLDNGCNLAGDVPALAYRIEDNGDGPTVEWEEGPINITAEQALSAESSDPHKRTEDRECIDWLREIVSTGPVPAEDVFKAGRQAGFSQDQLKRAKRPAGVVSKRDGYGPKSRWLWMFPGDDRAEPTLAIEST
jgi:putative DNA primase/helicase